MADNEAPLAWNLPTNRNVSCYTTGNLLEASCYGRGQCVEYRNQGYWCECAHLYDTRSYCDRNDHQAWGLIGLVHPMTGLIVVFPFFILYLLEIVTDLRANQKVLRLPSFWAKCGMFVLSVARMILFPFLIYDTFVERVTNYHVLLAAEGVGVAFIAITFPLITISWLDVLLRAKSLGASNKHIRRMKIALYVVVSVVGPGMLATRLASAFYPSNALTVINYVLVLIIALTVFGMTCGLLTAARRWLNQQVALQKDSLDKRVHRVYTSLRRKTRYIIVMLANLVVLILLALVQLIVGVETPAKLLLFATIARMCELSFLPVLFLFLQNHFGGKVFLGQYFAKSAAVSSIEIGRGTSSGTTPITKSGGSRRSVPSPRVDQPVSQLEESEKREESSVTSQSSS